MHDFHQPPAPHPPNHHLPNFLFPHEWYIIFHNFSSPSLCWSSHAWFPPPTRPPPLTQLFVTPFMIHYFWRFFKPNITLIIPCMTSTTLPPPTQFFVSQCMIHHFSQFFKPIIADHPMHDFYHQTTNHPPIHPPPTQLFVSPIMMHHFSRFFKPIIADHPMDRTILVQVTQNFGSKFVTPFVII